MGTPTRHLIGRDCAAPQGITRWCRARWPEQLPPGLIFCVPTSLALRRLRDALTRAYGAFQGVRFLTPSALPTLFTPTAPEALATPAEGLRVWDRVVDWLQAIDDDHLVARWLFPGKREWLARPRARYAVARKLIQLRATLAEAGLDFAAVANHPETAALGARECGRWQALDALESKARELLRELKLVDPIDHQLATFRNPAAQPQEVSAEWQLIIACVPDFMPTLATLFAAAPHCDILVQAEADEGDRFDELGRPLPEVWGKQDLHLPDAALRVAETPAEEAATIDRWLDTFETIDPAELALCLLNPEVIPPLTTRLKQHALTIFEPEPISLSTRPPARALKALSALAADPRPDRLFALLSLPEVTAALKAPYAELRAALLETFELHHPQTLSAVARFTSNAALKVFVAQCVQWMEAFRANAVEGARTFLSELYGARQLDPTRDPLDFATFEALHALFTELSHLRVGGESIPPELLEACLKEVALHPVRQGADCAYEGRLEVLWSEAPLLVLGGLNEGFFPDTAFEDIFLPNHFRRLLGLRNDRTRVARDAYLLATACAMRRAEHLCLTTSRASMRGDWLKPSRLLFQCDAPTQATRARRLFSDPTTRPSEGDATSALRFAENPIRWREAKAPTRLSSSQIKAYLASPLMWWLTYPMRLEDTPDELPEGVSPSLLGNLIHATLAGLKDLPKTAAPLLYEALKADFDRRFALQYGATPDIELLAAQNSAHHRLRAMARLEDELSLEGWQTLYTEADTKDWTTELALPTGSVTLYGQIDRVDYHPSEKIWRVIDYKTSAKPTAPNSAHYHKAPTGGYLWADFQLPIYRLIVSAALKLPADATIELAYISLPAEGQAALTLFTDPTSPEDTLEALRTTVAKLYTAGASPLPAQVGAYDNPLLARLMPPPPESTP